MHNAMNIYFSLHALYMPFISLCYNSVERIERGSAYTMKKKIAMSTVAFTCSIALATTFFMSSTKQGQAFDQNTLQFNEDGKYKVVQFNDTQDNDEIDQRTVELMGTLLDEEKPDLAIINGDMLDDAMDSAEEVKEAIDHIAQPMEERGVHWAVTFGNHDEDHTEKTGMDEEKMLEVYMSYEHNVNKDDVKEITGTGNANLVINDSKGEQAAFNIWLFDSGRYAPEEIHQQDFEGYPSWDWLRYDQVNWYYETSKQLEESADRTIPSLAFMHIPLPEFEHMWFASPFERDESHHQNAIKKHELTGEKNEGVSTGPFNSGMFAAMLERGDVKGVFSGHDHINTFVGNYYGIQLGYAGSVGFGTYGLEEDDPDRLRGARIFHLDENKEEVYVDTEMIFANEYGIE